MKNIFKTTPFIPSNITFFFKGNLFFIKGPKGSSCLDISFMTEKKLPAKTKKIFYSSFFRLFQKRLLGVCLKFVTSITFVGIGFRIESIENGFIKLKLGFSHLIFVRIPPYINVFIPQKTILVLDCIDDQLLNEFCSKIKLLKSPDAYKGKGILSKNQVLILKEGKKK